LGIEHHTDQHLGPIQLTSGQYSYLHANAFAFRSISEFSAIRVVLTPLIKLLIKENM